jgi:hypothetical protein
MDKHSHVHHQNHEAAPTTAHQHNSPKILDGPARHMLAFSATMHCLIGTALTLGMVTTMVLAIILGFVLGFLFGMIPLLRAGFGVRRAFQQVLIAEGLSIAVMEAFEVLVQVYMPGVMEAGLGDAIFWYGMLAALVVGFVAAYPVNWYLIGKGVRHQHQG